MKCHYPIKVFLKREYSGVLATVVGFVFIDDLRRYFETGQLELETTAHWVLGVTIILVLILRSLKHYTQVFKEEGRS